MKRIVHAALGAGLCTQPIAPAWTQPVGPVFPSQEEMVAQVNPHALLDSQRWFADEAADYLRFQAAILRKVCGQRQWITSNFMHQFSPVNPSLSA